MAKTGLPQGPKGLKSCDQDAVKDWQEVELSQAPYQHKLQNMVRCLRTGSERRLVAVESERFMGYRDNYTAVVLTLGLEPRDLERSKKGSVCLAMHGTCRLQRCGC